MTNGQNTQRKVTVLGALVGHNDDEDDDDDDGTS